MIFQFSLRNTLKNLTNYLKSISHSKSKFNIIIDILILLSFAGTIFSIPAFSSNSILSKLTWCFTIMTLGLMTLALILYGKVKIDLIACSLVMFCVSALLSSIFNGFQGFKFTSIFLTTATFLIYIFCKSNKNIVTFLLFSAFLASIMFLVLFLLKEKNHLISLNFDGIRLGSDFGDENDIAIIFAFGIVFCLFCLIYIKTIVFKIVCTILFVLFALCGVSTGSKTFLLLCIVTVIALIFIVSKKIPWWLTLLFIVGSVALFYLALNLKPLHNVKVRVDDFIATLFTYSKLGGASSDLSTVERIDMIFCGLDLFARKPLFGYGTWGLASFAGYNFGWSHNHLVESLCNYGLVGTTLFHIGFGKSITNYIKNKNKNKEDEISILFVIFFITTMISVALFSQKIYAFFIGVIFSILTIDEKSMLEFAFLKRNRYENR